MPDTSLPETISAALGAKLAGKSRAAFKRRYIEAGLVEIERTLGGRVVVALPSLEAILGRRITAAEFRAAERELAPARQYQTEYRNRRVSEGSARHSPVKGPLDVRPA